jgi:hypothetical protein
MIFLKKIINLKIFFKWLGNYFSLNSKFCILNTNQKGQSLIEVLIIVVLITAVISGSIGFLVQSYVTAQLVAEQTTATYLSMEGVELAKNLIDANYCEQNGARAWDYGIIDGEYEIDWAGSKLNPIAIEPRNLFYVYYPDRDGYRYEYNSSGNESSYSRIIKIQKFPAGGQTNEIKVNSIVEWQSRRGKLKVELEDHFYDWRPTKVSC